MEDALDLVPGAFPQSSLNFAQDNRLSLRGFGARASFGVRGIQVRVDDVPTTLPDGQTELDSLDLLRKGSEVGTRRFFLSDVPVRFREIGGRFLGEPIEDLTWIEQSDIPWYER